MSQPLLRIHLHGRHKVEDRTGRDRAKIDLTAKEAGQIIVVFALMLTVLIGLVGIAIDVTYAWRTGLQIQRAADAGSLAGVVYLPGDVTTADSTAIAEVADNGYTANTTTTVTAAPNPANNRQLNVTVTAQVPTFFIRIFGINSWTITRQSRAAFVMPVPMGSPLAYYGVGCLILTGSTPACNSNGTGASGVTTLGTSGGTPLSSLGAWGAVITKGGYESNGDAYSPANNNDQSWTVNTTTNVSYDLNGYYYTAVLPAGGSIEIFDPGFCAMGGNGASGYLGTGDHWIAGASNPVSTYYTLWDTHNVPLNPGGWTKTGNASGTTFENEKGYDPANLGTGGAPSGATSGCNSNGLDAYHDKWWTLASSLPAGTYEVEVSTTNQGDSSVNASTNAENMFSIMAVGGGSPAVYGYNRMAVYNNLVATGVLQQFYMAQVDQVTGSGKTLTIDLFDIGDSTAGYIQILSPNGPGGTQTVVNNFSYTTFNYNSAGARVSPGNCVAGNSDTCSGTGRNKITVATSGGGSSFNNTWIEITIPLGNTYGSGGLWQGGWWQVQYNVTAGNDTTTWSVNVMGNPVHLVPTN
jgi:hypothetical protein